MLGGLRPSSRKDATRKASTRPTASAAGRTTKTDVTPASRANRATVYPAAPKNRACPKLMMPAKPQTRSKLSASNARISTRVTKMTQKSASANGSSAKVTSSPASSALTIVAGATASALLGVDEPFAPRDDVVGALLRDRGVRAHLAVPLARHHLR